jgi:hypothetical protein
MAVSRLAGQSGPVPDAAELSTNLLRNDPGPLWSRLRELLVERGLDPKVVALAQLFPDDTDMEFGIVVTPGREVFTFDLRYGDGDLIRQAASSYISEWRILTDWWRDSPYREDVIAAIELLGREGTAT